MRTISIFPIPRSTHSVEIHMHRFPNNRIQFTPIKFSQTGAFLFARHILSLKNGTPPYILTNKYSNYGVSHSRIVSCKTRPLNKTELQ